MGQLSNYWTGVQQSMQLFVYIFRVIQFFLSQFNAISSKLVNYLVNYVFPDNYEYLASCEVFQLIM